MIESEKRHDKTGDNSLMCFDRPDIASFLVWRGNAAIDYSIEEVARYGLDAIYQIICDNYADDCEIGIYDVDGFEIGNATVGELRKSRGCI